MDESDTESDIEEDEDIENPEPKEEDSDVDLLIAPNDLVITGSADATAKVWSVYSGECIHVSINSQIWYLLFSKPCSKNLSNKRFEMQIGFLLRKIQKKYCSLRKITIFPKESHLVCVKKVPIFAKDKLGLRNLQIYLRLNFT